MPPNPTNGEDTLYLPDALVQTSFMIQSILSKASAHRGLTALQGRLLGVLRDRQPTMTELGVLLHLDKASTTGLVNRASRGGLVTQRSDDHDRRIQRVELTSRGHRLALEYVTEVHESLTTPLATLIPSQSATLGELLSRVISHSKPATATPRGRPRHSVGGTRVALVVGSTRPTRVCLALAEAVRVRLGRSLDYEIIDLAKPMLPFLDEPEMPALGNYLHPHTRDWSATISTFDGFILVFPQYNWGYPAPLKNALDYLYLEWHDKPVSYITYGTQGGNKAGAQIRDVLQGLHMQLLASHCELIIKDEDYDETQGLGDLDALLSPYESELREIAKQMTEALAGPSCPRTPR